MKEVIATCAIPKCLGMREASSGFAASSTCDLQSVIHGRRPSSGSEGPHPSSNCCLIFAAQTCRWRSIYQNEEERYLLPTIPRPQFRLLSSNLDIEIDADEMPRHDNCWQRMEMICRYFNVAKRRAVEGRMGCRKRYNIG